MWLLLLLQVVVTGNDGTSATGAPQGSVTLKLDWGTLTVPLAEIDRIEFCPVRQDVMANLGGAVNRALELGGDEGEAKLKALGPAAIEYLQPIAELALGEGAERLWRVIQHLQAQGWRPPNDQLFGPGIVARGWVQDASFTLNDAKRPVASTRTIAAVKPHDRAGGMVVRMTDGTMLAGRFGKGTLKVGDKEIAIEKIRTLVIAAGGKARVEADKAAEGKIDAKTILFEGAFGAIDLPLKSVGAAMRADWSLYESPKPDREGFLRDWLLYGNLPQENDQFEVNHLDAVEEAAVVPSAGEEMFGRKWSAYTSPRNDVALLEALPAERRENFVAYGALYLRSPRAAACTALVQSDDGVRLWLNGALVHSNHSHRGVDTWPDHVAVTLQPGWNRLLIKIDNGAGPSGWRVRFVDGAEKPIPDLMLSLKAPPIFQGR